MTAFNPASFRPVFGKDTNPNNNELLWTSDLHAHMLILFLSGDAIGSATAPADTTKLWYQPHATNGGNGAFKLFSGGTWQTVTAALFFEWLRTRAAYSPAGGLAAVAHDATLTGDGTAGNPLSVAPSGGGLTSVTANAPLTGLGTAGSPLDIAPATTTTDGSMSAADKVKLDAITLPVLTPAIITGTGVGSVWTVVDGALNGVYPTRGMALTVTGTGSGFVAAPPGSTWQLQGGSAALGGAVLTCLGRFYEASSIWIRTS